VIDAILEVAGRLDKLLWGPWTMLFIASVSVYLTIRTRCFQLRRLRFIISNTIGTLIRRVEQQDESGKSLTRRLKGRMTPFQATATALASTVGMGSIAGLAAALSIGGAGAVFWMWLLALLGTVTKTAEITLAVHYRDIGRDGRIRGGPMYYIRRGLGWPFLAVLFSLGIFVNALCSASLLQAHTVGRAFLASYDISPYLVAGGMTVVTAVVVIGGLRRIGRFSEALVPLMSAVYVIGGLVIFAVNYQSIPDVFAMIVRHAFSPMPAIGGFTGAAVMQAVQAGMARGMFSNEAGLGTAPMAHATADTRHPFAQGMWGAFEVFMVTFVICTITAFAVLSTGVLASGESGIELVILAFSEVLPPTMAAALISFCILTFCLTTQIGFFVYYETACVGAFGQRWASYLRWLYFIPPVIFAGVAEVDRVWVFANIAVAVCALPNLVAVLALSGAFMKLMRDYLDGSLVYATDAVDGTRQWVRRARPERTE
jgi:AGCS family alanine or glycine:cation symporter